MPSPELIPLPGGAAGAALPLADFIDGLGGGRRLALATSAFRRCRAALAETAKLHDINVLEAVDGGDTSKSWPRLAIAIRDRTAFSSRSIVVVLDEPKAQFEGADSMSQEFQIAIQELQAQGWGCDWYAIRDLEAVQEQQAYLRLADWVTRGVALSSELLAFCSLDHKVPPDEHALEALGSKGAWKNRFGQVRLTASRALLASVRDGLDAGCTASSALLALSVYEDNLDPRQLYPGASGWGPKDFDRGWQAARYTNAALVHLWRLGRLQEAAGRRLAAMLSQENALAIVLGLRTGRDTTTGKACEALRRCEETLRMCRNVLEHSKGAPAGSFQLVGSLLVAAEAWEAGVRSTLDPVLRFPDEWNGWDDWGAAALQPAPQKRTARKSGEGGPLRVLAAFPKPEAGRLSEAFRKAGGRPAQLVAEGSRFAQLVHDCAAVTSLVRPQAG